MIHLAGTQRVDHVALRRACRIPAKRHPQRAVRFHLLEGVLQPQRLRAVQIAHAVRHEVDVDGLHRVVGRGRVDALDTARALVAVVEANVHGVHRVAPAHRRHGVAVALVDGGQGRPQRGDRLASVAHGGEGLGVDAAHQALAPVFGLRADGGDAGQRHGLAVRPHRERDVGEARRQLAVHEGAQRPLRTVGRGDDVVRPIAEAAAVDVAAQNAELAHLLGAGGTDLYAHESSKSARERGL